MTALNRMRCGALAAAVAWSAAASADATTLVRASLEDLVAAHPTAVVAEVTDAHSYWNDDKSFMLSDVHLAVRDVLRGSKELTELTVTLMGGSVDDLTTLIVGGAELLPGGSYVLFIGRSDLPGADGVLTVPEHCQGVFEIVPGDGGARAISQANGHPLVPDKFGYVDAPGGMEGFPLEALVQSIRDLTPRTRREVKP